MRPRSYLIVGSLDELIGDGGGVHHDKFRSFELHRRNLYEPEVLTFDEVLARAEWQVSKLAPESRSDPDSGAEHDDPWAGPTTARRADDPWGASSVGPDEPSF